MTPALIAALRRLVDTSFLSGVFGMAGGLVLVGVLLALLPLPAAMALHAGDRSAPTCGAPAVAPARLLRCGLALRRGLARGPGRLVADAVRLGKPIALLTLGATPFLVRLLSSGLKPDPERRPPFGNPSTAHG